jgi:amidase
MDYSAAVIPVTTANKEIDIFDKDYEPLNETDRKNWEACEYSSMTS